MLNIKDKTKCCGCGACAQICPKSAITMRADSEGFLYPAVDENRCVKCGLCVKTCPILNNKKQEFLPKVYAAKNKNTEVQKQSSSGGIFSVLADYVLMQKGVVFGAAFNEKWQVEHCFIEEKEDLDKLRRSKYVQSNTLNTFKEAKNFLEEGRQVLYTGTPCQIAGLKSFLGKNYDNLIAVDIICHGAPSPKVWHRFLEENFNLSNIQEINFREKSFGWNSFFDNYILKNEDYKKRTKFIAKNIKFKKIKSYIISHFLYSYFLKGFLVNLFLRPSCHACSFRDDKYRSDLTLADAWGINKFLPNYSDNKGSSYVVCNTEKGKKLFNLVTDKIESIEISIDQVKKYNFPLICSVKPHTKREEFFNRYQKEPINDLIKKLTYRPLWERILGKIKRVCKKIIKI